MELEQRLDKFEQKMEDALTKMADAITRLARFEERVSMHSEGQRIQGERLDKIEHVLIEMKTQLATNIKSISWNERVVWLMLSGAIGSFFFLIR